MLPDPPQDIEDREMLDLAGWLRSSGFTWSEIAKRVGLVDHVRYKDTHNLITMNEARLRHRDTPVRDVPDLLVRLFVLHLPVPEKRFDELVPERARSSLHAMALTKKERGTIEAPLALIECEGVFVVSDTMQVLGADDLIILPTGDWVSFSSTMTRKHGRRFLDLGTGSGLHALRASATFEQSVGVDISARAITFSRFNQRLNGLSSRNIELVHGDLYAPVAGKFDVIVCAAPFHPDPEHPEGKPGGSYYSGGRTGDHLTRRILAGLDTYLEEGGYCNVLGLTLHWKDGSTNPPWRDLADYDIVMFHADVPLDERIAGKKLVENLRRVAPERVEFGVCVVRKHAGAKRQGWTVRAPWVARLDFDVHDLFEEVGKAGSETSRGEVVRRFFGG
jgi:methylase of polypeptide subunit release factors